MSKQASSAWYWAGGYATAYWQSHPLWQALISFAGVFALAWCLFWLIDVVLPRFLIGLGHALEDK